jgi:hypothetical protein
VRLSGGAQMSKILRPGSSSSLGAGDFAPLPHLTVASEHPSITPPEVLG